MFSISFSDIAAYRPACISNLRDQGIFLYWWKRLANFKNKHGIVKCLLIQDQSSEIAYDAINLVKDLKNQDYPF